MPTGEVGRALAGRRVESLAMLLHGSELQLHLCGPGEKVREKMTVVMIVKSMMIKMLCKDKGKIRSNGDW